MRQAWLAAAAPAVLAGLLVVTGCRQRGAGSGTPAYEQFKWGSPKPISERVGGRQYVLPDGWKAAVAGVTRIRVSNFGALQYDPATVANSRRFQEVTGIVAELLPWDETTVAARTLGLFAARSDAVDVLCYDHAAFYVLVVSGGWVQPLDALWNDPNLWTAYAGSLQKGLTAPDGRIYGSLGPVETDLLYTRPSMLPTAPRTWQEVREAARRLTNRSMWGFVFPAGGEKDILYPFRAMVFSQGGRLVDSKRERLIVDSPEGRNAWKMLAAMVLTDRSAPVTVVDKSWMQASDAFALGSAVMVLSRAIDCNRYGNAQLSPGLRGDWAASPPPKWDAAQPDKNLASSMEIEGYMVNRFINDRQKAAAMLFIDYMRSYEASSRELIDEGNEAAVLAVYDSSVAKNIPFAPARRAAMANSVLEAHPPAGRAFTDLLKEYFARVARGAMDPDQALAELQLRMDDYAVPQR